MRARDLAFAGEKEPRITKDSRLQWRLCLVSREWKSRTPCLYHVKIQIIVHFNGLDTRKRSVATIVHYVFPVRNSGHYYIELQLGKGKQFGL